MTSEPIERTTAWPLAKRILFRFGAAFFVLANFPFPLDLIPSESLQGFFVAMTDVPVHAAARLLHVSVAVRPNGSGDTTYSWVQLFCEVILATLVTLVWSILDRRRADYERAWAILRVYLRFVLAAAMISYGAAKVIPSQFLPPTLDRLLQPFGNASPMGLLWTFMGASVAYNIFAGAGELLGGLLLTMRRTALLGALVSAGVLANVVMLNFAYDVPVKIYSSQLLLMALVIALPDAPRLIDFFVRNRPVLPAPIPRFTRSRATEIGGIVFRTLVVAAFLWMSFREVLENQKRFGPEQRSPLYGIWRIDDFQLDGRLVPTSDPARWRRIIFELRPMASVQLEDDSRQRLGCKLDEKNHSMTVGRPKEPAWEGTFTYTQPDSGTLTLDGTLGGRRLHVLSHKEPIPKFPLTTRGFHWINEYPFNR